MQQKKKYLRKLLTSLICSVKLNNPRIEQLHKMIDLLSHSQSRKPIGAGLKAVRKSAANAAKGLISLVQKSPRLQKRIVDTKISGNNPSSLFTVNPSIKI